jgi:hypothetical protein
MGRAIALVVACTVVTLAGCGGGGGAAGDPLVSGAMTGMFKGQAFTPAFGVATVYQGQELIAFGDGPVNCASPQSTNPPPGTTAVVSVPALAAGTYSSLFVQLVRSTPGSFDSVGSSDGTVTLSAVSSTSVAGNIDYSYTDSQSQQYAVSGTFEVMHCP